MLGDTVAPATLATGTTWCPIPPASDRRSWASVPEPTRRAWVARGEAALEVPWPRLPASLWLDFTRTGGRGRFETLHFTRRGLLHDLVLAECVEGRGRFVDAVVDAVWSVCEESSWTWPACLYMQDAGSGLPDVADPVTDLGAGETSALLAWTSYLLAEPLDAVSPLLRRRVAREVRRRAVDRFVDGADFWWRTAVNNWNPWICANLLVAGLLLEEDEARRRRLVEAVADTVGRFLDGYPADGGCDEGPTYWSVVSGCLFDVVDVLGWVTGGAVDLAAEPVVGRIARYILPMRIDGDWVVNFADGAATFRVNGPRVYRMGVAVGDPALAALGAASARAVLAEDPSLPVGMAGRVTQLLAAFFVDRGWMDEPSPGAAIDTAGPRDAWLPVIEVMTARDDGDDTGGWFVAAKAGHNDEVHNHNDVGQFVVFLDSEPVVVDAGVGPYTAQTFGEGRYDIWTMQSGWHNLPTIDGHDQAPGPSFRGRGVRYDCDEEQASLTVDLAGAYPSAAGVASWVRRVELRRGEDVTVTESWRLRRPAQVTLNLLTPHRPGIAGAGRVALGPAAVGFDHGLFRAEVDERPLVEPNLAAVWGPVLWRVRLVADVPAEGTTAVVFTRT